MNNVSEFSLMVTEPTDAKELAASARRGVR
jgi:hypothetical protein